jgi:fibronectin-binding autotransporter adhesin
MKLPHLHYIGLLCPLLASTSLYAANRTWDGGGTGDVWSSNQNWNGNSALATGDTLVFAGTTKLSNTNDLSSFSFPTITFDATAGAFILGGNSFTLTGNIINNSTNLQTIGNNITLSATTHTINAASGNIALSGILSGTGATLTKSGPGTLILSSSNTYTGATTVSAGVLQLGNGGTTGTLSTSSSIINNANLTIDRSNTVTQGTDFTSSTISGTGSFTQAGSGTTILIAANSYTGITTISAGILQLGDGGTTGSLSASSAITNNANLTINRSNTVTQGTDFGSAAITGTGSFTQAGTGTTILTAANSYTGTTTISAGFLQLGNGGTTGALSASSAITNNANLTINRSNTVTQGTDFSSAAITGTGSFTQAGTGTTILNAANTYSGSTTINAGSLSVNGTLANTSNVNVLGGTLGGSGTIGGATTVGGNGTLAAGSSPGVLTVTNNLTLTQEVGVDGGSLAHFEIGGLTRGSEYDGVDVGGTLTYGGTLEIVSFNDYDLTDVATFTNPITVFDLFGMPGSPNDPTFSGNFDHVSVGGYALNNVGSGIWTGSNDDASVTYTFDQSTGDLSIVPEPVAAFLGGIGLLTLLRRRRN